MTKLALACGLALSLMACASNPETSSATAPAAGGSTAPSSSTAPAVAQAAPAKPKLVCEEQKPLGSLLPQRICMTPEEAAARKKASQDRMRQLQDQSSVGPGSGSSSGG